jgi:hypothetical protein
VEDLEVLVADNDKELLEIKRNQASQKVAVIQEVVDKGNYDLAADMIADYRKDVSSVIDIMNSAEDVDKDEVKEALTADLKLIDFAAVNLNVPGIKEAKRELSEVAQSAGIELYEHLGQVSVVFCCHYTKGVRISGIKVR